MTTTLPERAIPAADAEGLPLRASSQLERVPPPRPAGEPPPASPPAAESAAPAEPAPPPASPGVPAGGAWPKRVGREMTALLPASTWIAGGATLLASVAWLVERRRRVLLETRDSMAWASSQNVDALAGPPTDPHGKLDKLLPDGPDPSQAAARAIYASAIGETDSRREATLIDLHQLKSRLDRRLERGDDVAATLLLQQHLVDFRYTSPWVFLELRELYRELERPRDWDLARDAFRQRFGQNAPAWEAKTTAFQVLADDAQLCADIARQWPYRETRLYILRWMLGDPQARQRGSGPPQLPLGVYRDLLMLDELMDEVMAVRPRPTEALL